jgi:hypothetical protein
MIVLDFCEWLKSRATQQHGENYADMFDLIYNGEYSGVLRRFAEEYLQGGRPSLRGMLHSFIDSKELDEYCNKDCHPFFLEEMNHLHRAHPKELRYFLHHCFHHPEAERAFDRFIHRYYGENSNELLSQEKITPKALADSVVFYFEQRNEPFVLEFMTMLGTDLSLEIDFLEWLMLNIGNPINLNKMPLSLFENIADDYCKFANRHSDDKTKLVKSFKQSDTVSLGKKLVAVLTHTQADKMKSLGYIYDRYSNETIPFRCFFLPLASDGDAFKKFIKKNWVDLHTMSGNHLDIYYSEEDFGSSGYAIKNGMRMAPKDLPGKLPCLVIWQDKLQDAQAVDIEGLSDREIVRLIAVIVDLIKADKPLKIILKEATDMAKKINQEHTDANRPITSNTFNIERNTGVVSGYIANSNVTVYSGAITSEKFETETEKAVEIINSFTDVEKEYREALISLVKEAFVATQNKDEAAKSECKSKFKGFMLGAGKVVGGIVTKLSELATIAGFFGLAANIMHS